MQYQKEEIEEIEFSKEKEDSAMQKVERRRWSKDVQHPMELYRNHDLNSTISSQISEVELGSVSVQQEPPAPEVEESIATFQESLSMPEPVEVPVEAPVVPVSEVEEHVDENYNPSALLYNRSVASTRSSHHSSRASLPGVASRASHEDMELQYEQKEEDSPLKSTRSLPPLIQKTVGNEELIWQHCLKKIQESRPNESLNYALANGNDTLLIRLLGRLPLKMLASLERGIKERLTTKLLETMR